MGIDLVNPRLHKDWLSPHSIAWYEQLGKLTGEYSYPWNSTIPKPDVEAIFEGEVAKLVPNKKVLDVGCGHGDFTIRWSSMVTEIVGLDITSNFIETSKSNNLDNVTFIAANTKQRLPFDDDEFDFAYNRKGPTSAYLDLKRIVKDGGQIIALHPGDRTPELPHTFPNLFELLPEGTPRLDKIIGNLEKGMLLKQAEIETVTSVSYLPEPLDVVKVCCFGQTPSVHEMVINHSMSEIEKIFYKNSTEMGLPITGKSYIVRISV